MRATDRHGVRSRKLRYHFFIPTCVFFTHQNDPEEEHGINSQSMPKYLVTYCLQQGSSSWKFHNLTKQHHSLGGHYQSEHHSNPGCPQTHNPPASGSWDLQTDHTIFFCFQSKHYKIFPNVNINVMLILEEVKLGHVPIHLLRERWLSKHDWAFFCERFIHNQERILNVSLEKWVFVLLVKYRMKMVF